MSDTDTVLATVEGRIGRLMLNRPRALNALDPGMIAALATHLLAWRDRPEIHAVLIEGAGGRAFCAGGDVRAMRDAALAGDTATIEAFFAAEYALNRLIAEYPKPYVALIDGVCMGGGLGVSVHGTWRIATEAALFAMPETAIALFPDIGASFFLPRLPGELGLYLGLTGTRLTGADAVHAGLATHFVPRAAVQALLVALIADGVAAVPRFAVPLPPSGFAGDRAAIDHCFSASSVPEIRVRLAEEPTAWAASTRAALDAASPSALLWTFDLLRAGAHRTLAECLAAELALTRIVTLHPDFAEGVRAAIIDKDRAPRWAAAPG